MGTVQAPYGFRPIRLLSGRETGGAFPTELLPIKNNYATILPNGSPVVLSAPASVGTVTGTSGTGTVATLTFSGAHGLVTGQVITVTTVVPTAFNGTFYITSVPTTTTLTYTYAGGAYVSGTAAVTANGGFLNPPTDGGFNSLADNYIGVFVGATYTNPTNSQPQWDQWYPGNLNTPDNSIQGYVVTDPEAIYSVQAHYPNFDALSYIGYSFKHFVPSPAYTTGTKDSVLSLDAGVGSSGTGTAYPWKVVGISQGPDNINASGYVNVLVKANPTLHIFEREN